jgi:hypothetical protein
MHWDSTLQGVLILSHFEYLCTFRICMHRTVSNEKFDTFKQQLLMRGLAPPNCQENSAKHGNPIHHLSTSNSIRQNTFSLV